MVGRVGFEPTMFLMSRFYRPLASPICIPTDMVPAPGLEPGTPSNLEVISGINRLFYH